MEDYTYLEYIKAVGRKEAQQFTRAMKNPLTRFEDELQGCLWDGVGY
jgi:Holliday junction resolvasome RuvABC DNA-binding subunit